MARYENPLAPLVPPPNDVVNPKISDELDYIKLLSADESLDRRSRAVTDLPVEIWLIIIDYSDRKVNNDMYLHYGVLQSLALLIPEKRPFGMDESIIYEVHKCGRKYARARSHVHWPTIVLSRVCTSARRAFLLFKEGRHVFYNSVASWAKIDDDILHSGKYLKFLEKGTKGLTAREKKTYDKVLEFDTDCCTFIDLKKISVN